MVLTITRYRRHFIVYFFGGLEFVGHSFAYVAHLLFLRDVWIRTQSTAVASWRATDLATHPSQLIHPSLYLATHPSTLPPIPILSHPSLFLATLPKIYKTWYAESYLRKKNTVQDVSNAHVVFGL
jgi:hypothetical protein